MSYDIVDLRSLHFIYEMWHIGSSGLFYLLDRSYNRSVRKTNIVRMWKNYNQQESVKLTRCAV